LKKLVIIITLLAFAFSCNRKAKPPPPVADDVLLAEVKTEMLYLSYVPSYGFNGLNAEDSVTFLKKYVENWIKDQVMILKAEQGVKNLEEIEFEAEKYKNDLIKAGYQKKLMETAEIVLTDADLKEYYQKHKEYYMFDEDYFEMKYIILPKNVSNIQQIRKNVSEGKNSNFLSSYCASNSEKCQIDKSQIKSETFLRSFLKLPENMLVVSGGYKYHYIDDENVMIYNILSIKKKGETAPLELVQKEVSIMTMHNKKQEYLLELEEKTYQKAKNDKIFENYIN